VKRIETENGMRSENISLFFLVEYGGSMKVDKMVRKKNGKGSRSSEEVSKKNNGGK
jgi:hypothetical protein